MQQDVKTAASAGFDAFWTEIARLYPDVDTGDFPPDAWCIFLAACEDAVTIWLQYNREGLFNGPG
jgi:hypothetical protein